MSFDIYSNQSLFLGKKLSDGKSLGGKGGGLTITKCDTIQNFYGKCIRDNKNDPTGMSKATIAILDHYSSTPDKPRHDSCPQGINSWCSYNKDKALNTHFHKPIKNALRPAVREVMLPLFNRLSDESFLEGCKECYTQNPNESVHHIIWSLATKDQFNSPMETSLAISLGTCVFNSGLEYTAYNLLKSCDITVSQSMVQAWRKIDNERMQQSEYKERESVQLRRKQVKRNACKKQDAFLRFENTHYQSGSFHQNDTEQQGNRGRGSRGRKVGRGRGRVRKNIISDG